MGLSNIAAGIGIFIAVLFFLGYITVPVLIILYFSGLSFFGLASRMNKDFTSDRILVMLKRAAAINLISRNKINMMLTDVYIYRGEIGNALALLEKIPARTDRQKLKKILSYTFIYELTDDRERLLSFEQETDEIIGRNMNKFDMVRDFLTISARISKTKGEYRKALEILDRLDALTAETRAKNDRQLMRASILYTFLKGFNLMKRAELLFLLDYIREAGETLSQAMPMLAYSPFVAQKAIDLMIQIRNDTRSTI
ncbi:MAG: hypothetical protein II936_07190 [Oscillospiraceae bacterium]|nr:hypothetical protein [Oscillospiraceae bacterium]